MSTQQQQLDYMERYLVYDIFKYFGSDAALISHSIECSNGLDGFMSALYTIKLDIKIDGKNLREVVLAKFMKGSKEFRKSSKSYELCANEIFLYAELLPAYKHLLRSSKLNTDLVEQFAPRCYRATYGVVEALSDDNESVLAMQHLRPAGFELGPRLVLRQDQLEAMSVVIGKFHALGYAIRVIQPQVHDRLRTGLKTVPFVSKAGEPDAYAAIYRVAFDRFYEFYDRSRDQLLRPSGEDAGLAAALERLRAKYFDQPVSLMEHIRSSAYDEKLPENNFSTFLHGDFNRNNVLFHEDDNGNVDNITMIDYQEMRFSTIAMDVSFYLYFNTPETERAEWLPKLLRLYHKSMFEMLELLLQRNCDETLTEERIQKLLTDYSFERFEAHFKRYAFYGVMICIHFMPWLLGSESDCDKLSKLFETDMHGAAFHQLSMEIAGDEANHKIFNVVRHAYEQGYMDCI